MTRKPRRASDALLPRSPLELAWPLHVHGPDAEGAAILAELGAQEADLQRIANACLAAVEWLLARGAWQSALLYAQAAALAWPHNPRLAWAAGRMLRNYGQMREAETWLRRAARIAVWNGDVETQDLALNSLGNLYAQKGCYKEALRILNRALKLAERVSRTMRAEVSHDLVLVYIALGQFARAEEMAASAFRLYGADHPKLARLAFDVALLWSEQGRFPIALPVLRALLPVHNGTVERLLVIGAVARAAGAVGDVPMFEFAWNEVWAASATKLGGVQSALPAVFAELGEGAASLRDWTRAKEAYDRALYSAEEAGEYDVIARVEEALAKVARHERIAPDQRPSAHPAVQLSKAIVRMLENRVANVDALLTGNGEG